MAANVQEKKTPPALANGRPAKDWYTRDEIMTFLGIEGKQFVRYKERLKEGTDWINTRDKSRAYYSSHAFLRVRYPNGAGVNGITTHGPHAAPLGLEDADQGDPQGRLRLANARLAEIKLARVKAEICSIESVRSLWSRISRIVRECAERLQRDYGNAVSDELNRSLDNAEREVADWKPC